MEANQEAANVIQTVVEDLLVRMNQEKSANIKLVYEKFTGKPFEREEALKRLTRVAHTEVPNVEWLYIDYGTPEEALLIRFEEKYDVLNSDITGPMLQMESPYF